MAKTKRNPGINWGSPIQEQTPRQQARFLLLVEQVAAIRKGFSADCSLVANPVTQAVLEVAGVPLELLDPSAGFNYPGQLDEVLKAPWKENKKHPHFAVMAHTKDALFELSYAVSGLQSLKDEPPTYASEKRLSQEIKYLMDGRLPSVTLAYRHLITDYAKALISNGGNFKGAGLWFDPTSLAAIGQAAAPVTAQLKAEADAIRAERRAEYKERFGHQPSTGDDFADLRQGSCEAFGMTMEEWFAKKYGRYFGPRSDSSIGSPGAPSHADYRALGLSPGASEAEIQAAFRKLAKQHHPDAGGCAKKFQMVAEAYNRIKEVAK